MRLRLLAVVVALAALSTAAPQAQDPTAYPRLVDGDITYLGQFTVPTAGPDNGPQDLTEGGPLGIAADGTSLWIGCHQPRSIARISIPSINGQATLLEPCREIVGTLGIPDQPVLGGLLAYNSRLLASKFVFYDGDGAAWYTHQVSSDGGTIWGPVTKVGYGSLNAGFFAGYMAPIPSEWRSLMGGPALVGQGILSIISRTSFGPAAFVFDPDDVGVDYPAAATPLVYYTYTNPLSNPEVQNSLFTRADKLGGVMFPGGTRSVLFIGTHGMGNPCYGQGSSQNPPPAGQCYDPLDGAQGEHTYPYRLQVWAYDANDLVSVKTGATAPYAVKPYAVWTLPGVSTTSYRVKRGGAVYNPANRRLYVAQEYGSSPRIDVFQVDADAVDPEDPDPEPEPEPDPDPAPPPSQCLTAPLRVQVTAWPSALAGNRQGKWRTSHIAASVQFTWSPQRIIVTDTRGCTSTVSR